MDDAIRFDGSDLEHLARDIRSVAQNVRRETDRTVHLIGGEIAASAHTIASQHSPTVAATIKLKLVPGAAIISSGNEQTPIAALWETGNKGSKVTATTFRHPVFGRRDNWVEQPRHPSLRPALALNRRQITKRMEQAWDHALIPYRMKPGG